MQHKTADAAQWSTPVRVRPQARTRTIGGLADGTYNVRVAATNSEGDSDWSTAAPVTLRAPLGQPQNVTAVSGDAQITLTWQAPAAGTITGYRVRHRKTTDANWAPTVDKTATELTHTFEDLDNAAGYTVAVAARDAAGIGDWATATATPCGLVHHWTLDETTGTTAADTAGDNDGTVTGATWTTAGQDGGALSFDGSGDFIQIGADALPAAGCGWTAALWVKRSANTASSALFAPANHSGTAAVKLEQWNNTQQVGITRFGVADTASTYTAPLNTWAHLVLVGTPTDTKLYADGTLQHTFNISIDLPLHRIGAYTTGGALGSDNINAVLDDIRIYAKALTATEVTALHNQLATAGSSGQARSAQRAAGGPTEPQDLSVTPADGSMELIWREPSSDGGSAVTGYVVLHRETGAGEDAWVDESIGADARSHTIADLTNGHAYDLRVAATNAVGGGAWASAGPVTAGAPGAPADVRVTPGDESLTLAWAVPASDGGSPVTGYVVGYRESHPPGGTSTGGPSGSAESSSVEPSDDGSGWVDVSVAGDALSHTLEDLTNGTAYDLRVAATNAVGGGVWGSAGPVTAGAPGAPAGVRVMPGDGSLALAWAAPASGSGSAVTGYVIQHRETGTDDTWTEASAPADTRSHTLDGLTNGTTYDVRVTAVNIHGTGIPATVGATPLRPPDVPINVRVSPGDGFLALSWAAPAYDGGSPVTGYVIGYKESSADDDTWSETAVAADVLSHTLDSLTNGTAYDLRIAAINAAGPGIGASAGPVMPGGPGAPTDVRVSPGDGFLAMSWAAPSFDGGSPVTGYVIGYKESSADDDAWSETALAADVLSHTLDSLTNGTAYDLRVAAVNTAGTGTWATLTGIPHTVPDAPQDLTATPGDGSLALAWTAPASDGGSPVTGYVISVADPLVGASAEVRVAAGVLSYPFVGLANETTYDVSVAATNAAGTGTWTTLAAAPAATPTVPGAPQDLTVTPGDGSLALAWAAPASDGGSPVTGYIIEHKETSAGDDSWTEASVAADTLSHTLEDLTNGTTYDIRIAAANTAGTSTWTTLTATPEQPEPEQPDAPQDLTVTPGDGSLALAWAAPASDGGSPVTGYIIEHKETSAGDDSWTEASAAADARSHTLEDLTNGTTYDIRIAAANTAGTSTWTTLTGIPGTVPEPQQDPEAEQPEPEQPDAPQDLTVTPGDGSLALAWAAPASDGGSPVTGYIIEHKEASAGDDSWTEASAAADARSHTLEDLTNGTTYDIRIAAANTAGTSTWTTLTGIPGTVPEPQQDPEAEQPEPEQPDAPQDLTVTPGDGSLALAWAAPASDGGSPVTGYIIEHKEASAGDDSWTEASAAADTLSHTLEDLTNGTTYDIRIAAANTAGTSTWTTLTGIPGTVPEPQQDPEAEQPEPEQPDAPQDLTVTPGDGSLALAWAAPASDGGSPVTGYIIEHKEASAGDDSWTEASVAADTLSHTLEDLTNGTTYDIRIAAANTAGTSTWTTLTGIPGTVPEPQQDPEAEQPEPEQPDAPQDLTVTPGDGSLALAWAAPASDGGSPVTGYIIEHKEASAGDDSWTEASVAADTLSHTLEDLTNGTTYDIRIAAANTAGTSTWTTLTGIPGTVPEPQQDPEAEQPEPEQPDAPQDLTVTPGDGSLALAWAAPASDGGSPVTGYIIEHKEASAGDDSWTEASVAADTLSHTLEDLTNGTTYDIRIAAANTAGTSTWATLTGIPGTVPEPQQDPEAEDPPAENPAPEPSLPEASEGTATVPHRRNRRGLRMHPRSHAARSHACVLQTPGVAVG